MKPLAATIIPMGVDAPVLLWTGGVLLLLGLFFAVAGRRPARRDRTARRQAAREASDGASGRVTGDS